MELGRRPTEAGDAHAAQPSTAAGTPARTCRSCRCARSGWSRSGTTTWRGALPAHRPMSAGWRPDRDPLSCTYDQLSSHSPSASATSCPASFEARQIFRNTRRSGCTTRLSCGDASRSRTAGGWFRDPRRRRRAHCHAHTDDLLRDRRSPPSQRSQSFSSCMRELAETMTHSSISCAKIRPEYGAAALRRRGTGQTHETDHPSTDASLNRSHSRSRAKVSTRSVCTTTPKA